MAYSKNNKNSFGWMSLLNRYMFVLLQDDNIFPLTKHSSFPVRLKSTDIIPSLEFGPTVFTMLLRVIQSFADL